MSEAGAGLRWYLPGLKVYNLSAHLGHIFVDLRPEQGQEQAVFNQALLLLVACRDVQQRHGHGW